MEKKRMKQHGSGGKCGWSKEGQNVCKRLADKTVAQRKAGWQEQDERKHQEKFRRELGMQPASMKMRFLANPEDGGSDSNSEIKLGGEDAFEDC